MTKLRLGVLVSGGGSNLQSIIDHCDSGYLPAEVVIVISSKGGVYALKGQKTHIPSVVVSPKDYPNRQAYEDEMAKS